MATGYEAHERRACSERSRMVPRRLVLGRSGEATRFRASDPLVEALRGQAEREAARAARARAARLRGDA